MPLNMGRIKRSPVELHDYCVPIIGLVSTTHIAQSLNDVTVALALSEEVRHALTDHELLLPVAGNNREPIFEQVHGNSNTVREMAHPTATANEQHGLGAQAYALVHAQMLAQLHDAETRAT